MTFASAGFSVHSAVLGGDEVATLLEDLQTVARSRAGARHLMSRPAVARVARDARLLALAARHLGETAIPYRATLFDKSPGSNWLVTWHQDTALPVEQRLPLPGWGPWSVKAGVLMAHAPARVLESIVALRIHLDDSTASNGPLRVVPGSHGNGVLSDAELQRAGTKGPAVECLAARGGVVAMRPLIVHASSKALSPAPRRVLHVEYRVGLAVGSGLTLHVA